MKKILLAFSIISFPLTAMAADKPSHMSDGTIDAAVKKFAPSFCVKTVDGIKEAAEKVHDCYQKTPKDSPDLEICFLGDGAVNLIIQPETEEAQAVGKTSPFDKITYFSKVETAKRMKERSDFPKYKNYTNQENLDYQKNSIKLFTRKIIAFCKHSH
ncbi:hypothetical protein [Commensalibacter oyaizuii]|uniref:Uncharacterized protein n=1 Tax=Commensalibacter oyaizuii TaxID=3043873 RepID=A0ABT6Q3Q8_9PROT|nr:hypothetical protein [Commensalibacter sp. TBRC 16381]MDI2091734.1 hypothetical protein [Commensalibacter sp. TBRC 16381]